MPPVNPAMILHGEQSLELLQPLPTEGRFTLRSKVTGFYDKGKGTVMETESTVVDARGTPLCRMVSSSFIRGLTGFQGPKQPPRPTYAPPKRAPDAVTEQSTREDQALLYRLSGCARACVGACDVFVLFCSFLEPQHLT